MLIDSDILVDAGRNIEKAVDFLDAVVYGGNAQISVVSQMELIVGCQNKKELDVLDKFLSRFKNLGITEGTCSQAVALLKKYRLSHGLLIPDAFIAATAIIAHVPVATKNRRDFVFITELELVDY